MKIRHYIQPPVECLKNIRSHRSDIYSFLKTRPYLLFSNSNFERYFTKQSRHIFDRPRLRFANVARVSQKKRHACDTRRKHCETKWPTSGSSPPAHCLPSRRVQRATQEMVNVWDMVRAAKRRQRM